MPALTGGYSLSDNTFTNGMCYFHVLVNSAASGQYGPYGIYRNQYYRMTLNSIQAPGNPNDNFDHNQVISPNTWVDVNITVDEWQEIDEDCDLQNKNTVQPTDNEGDPNPVVYHVNLFIRRLYT